MSNRCGSDGLCYLGYLLVVILCKYHLTHKGNDPLTCWYCSKLYRVQFLYELHSDVVQYNKPLKKWINIIHILNIVVWSYILDPYFRMLFITIIYQLSSLLSCTFDLISSVYRCLHLYLPFAFRTLMYFVHKLMHIYAPFIFVIFSLIANLAYILCVCDDIYFNCFFFSVWLWWKICVNGDLGFVWWDVLSVIWTKVCFVIGTLNDWYWCDILGAT